jgi:hypothetical protein
VIRTTCTCDDGSGTFEALKHVFLTFTEGGATNVGPMQILGGTGDYAGIAGHGVDVGVSDDATGTAEGSITGLHRRAAVRNCAQGAGGRRVGRLMLDSPSPRPGRHWPPHSRC